MTDKELMQQALETLENLQGLCTDAADGWVEAVTIWTPEVIAALRERLEQPDQEPVAVVKLMETGGNAGLATVIHEIDNPLRERLRPGDKLYTAPQPRQWQGLTDEEIAQVFDLLPSSQPDPWWLRYGRAIQAHLKEKNT